MLVGAFLLSGYHEHFFTLRAEGFYAFLQPLNAFVGGRLRVALHALSALLVIVVVISHSEIRSRLSGTFGAGLGRISFPVYLMQMPVILSVGCWAYIALPDLNALARAATAITLSIVVSLIAALPVMRLDQFWLAFLKRHVG